MAIYQISEFQTPCTSGSFYQGFDSIVFLTIADAKHKHFFVDIQAVTEKKAIKKWFRSREIGTNYRSLLMDFKDNIIIDCFQKKKKFISMSSCSKDAVYAARISARLTVIQCWLTLEASEFYIEWNKLQQTTI